MRPTEEEARMIVERAATLDLVPRDVPGAPQGTHDFDMVEDGETIGALEVTTMTDESLRGLYGAMNRHGLDIDSESVARRWYVWLDEQRFSEVQYRDIR